GDVDKALELIRVKGLKGVAKREGRAASDGLVAVEIVDDGAGQTGVMVEVNSETDFVAKNETFVAFADRVLAAAVSSGAGDVESLLTA
ncbi:elongation factor Ts, partial [Georgenia sp. 10Sc9-8]|nr:elongation factor Ts [Georgenia halotolerans]